MKTSATSHLKANPLNVRKAASSLPYGVSSRVKFNLRVVLKNGDSFILAPYAKTAKEFRDGDITSVEGFSQQRAVSQGYIHIVR